MRGVPLDSGGSKSSRSYRCGADTTCELVAETMVRHYQTSICPFETFDDAAAAISK